MSEDYAPEYDSPSTPESRSAAREPLPEACACESCQDAAWPQAKGHDAAIVPDFEECGNCGAALDYCPFERQEVA